MEVIKATHTHIARFIYDAARIPVLTRDWVEQHVKFNNFDEYQALRNAQPDKGLLIATGHLGSFEILAHSSALYGYPLSFVVRSLPSKLIDTWWKGIREQNGNEVIDKKGAYREMIKRLVGGRDIGILFDQNIVRKRAVFVDFFGRPAATTKVLAMAALRAKPTVIVASIRYIGEDNYEINWEECKLRDLYQSNLKSDEKIKLITARVSSIYEDMIRKDPAAWLWTHRRWKTTPKGLEPLRYSMESDKGLA